MKNYIILAGTVILIEVIALCLSYYNFLKQERKEKMSRWQNEKNI